MDSFRDYLVRHHKEDLRRILLSREILDAFSIHIDFIKLFEADPTLGDNILCNPENTLKKCNERIVDAQKKLIEDSPEDGPRLKLNVNARFFGLPVCPELHRAIVPKNKDLNCFLKLTGTAVRLTQAKMLEYKRDYRCSKCGHLQTVEGKYEQRYVIRAPAKCNNPEMRCRSTDFAQVHDIKRENCKDYQEMKIQEQVNKSSVGGIPGSMWVTLEDDLVDCCKPGDDVNVCGTVLRRWRPLYPNKKCDIELVLKANHIEVCNTQKSVAMSKSPDVKYDFDSFWMEYRNSPMSARDIILASVCPKVYGLYMVKLALILTIITGCNHTLDVNNMITSKTKSPKDDEKDTHIRGQCHLLLVGDPGTGKSQLLKAGADLTTRSVLTSGSGSTKAGLTCTALREDGEWQLEAGALVLADGGVCCIDEIAQMRVHDRASIHEAMEQQTISVAKAGMICKLSTRCSVIAACNPKGNYDTEQPLSVNVSLGTPLLSRFDLIFILLDTQNSLWDNQVADYILFGKNSESFHPDGWSEEKLQCYVSLIGPYNVSMTNSATAILQAYYVVQRRAENRDPSRTTVRMLDSLVRLCQAHARLMYRKSVNIMDAITAVSLMDLSMQDCTLTGSSDALQTNFSEYPDMSYLKIAKRTLLNLNLPEIWHEELINYARILKVDSGQLDRDIENDTINNIFSHKINDSNNGGSKDVIESAYFQTEDLNVENSNSDSKDHNELKSQNKILKLSEEDEDIDNILDFEVSSANHRDLSAFRDTTNEDKVVSTKTVTDELLAKTLKKHSTLNTNTKMQHIGLISEKAKRKKNTRNKKQNLLKNQLPKTVKRKNNGTNGNRKKKQKTVDTDPSTSNQESDDNHSEDDEDVNETSILNCIPSVNDVFDGLNINFNINEDSSSHSESSHSVNINFPQRRSPVEILEEIAEEADTSKLNHSTENQSKVLNRSFIEKLNGFSFVQREKNPDETKSAIETRCIDKQNQITNKEQGICEESVDSDKTMVVETTSNKICERQHSSNSLFRGSMFESDDYSDLDL